MNQVEDEVERPVFSGSYVYSLSTKGKIRLPGKWIPKKRDNRDKPLLLSLGMVNRIMVFPESRIQALQIPKYCQQDGTRFTSKLAQTLATEDIHFTYPEFLLPEVNPKVTAGFNVALHEWEKFTRNRRISGKEFERIVQEILAAYGVSVQANLRVQGGEIDLMLLQITESGRLSFSIVECKHYAGSGKKVEAHHVFRLFGLQEIIKRRLPVEGSFVVSTTPLTRDASLNYTIIQIQSLPPPEFRQFCEWVESHRLKLNERRAPVFHLGTVSTRGEVLVPQVFARCLKGAKELQLTGALDRFELWSPTVYEAEKHNDSAIAASAFVLM